MALPASGCSVDLGPLVAADASIDARADACDGCSDATVDADALKPCAADEFRLTTGQCCPQSFSTTLPGAQPAGLVLHEDGALVYGTRSGRAWVARVSRCDGSIVAETSGISTENSAAFDADVSGSRVVLAGRVGDSNSNSRSLLAWGDAVSLGQFNLDLGETTAPSRADGVSVLGGDQAWAAATLRPGTNSARVQVRRVTLDFPSVCVEPLGGDYSSGQSIATDASAVWVANIQNLALYLNRYPLSACFQTACDCSAPGSVKVTQQTFAMMSAPRIVAVPGGVVMIASTIQDWGKGTGGGLIARVLDDLSVAASRYFPPSGSGLDRLFDIQDAGAELIVGGGWGCALTQTENTSCQGGRLFALSSDFNGASAPLWERNIVELERVSGVKLDPEAQGGMLVVGRAAGAPTNAVLMRCSRDGKCGAD